MYSKNGFKWLNWGLKEITTKVLNKRKGDYIYEENV